MTRTRVCALAPALALAASLAASPADANPNIGPAILTATVRDRDGKPVEGALVVADGPTSRDATTGAAGVVVLSALPVGVYDVRVTRAGFAPLGTRISLRSRPLPRVLALQLTRATFSNGFDPASSLDVLDLSGNADVLAAHVLSRSEEAELLPVRGTQTGAVPSLGGAAPGETRVELDGIPLAGGAAAFDALRERDALGLDDVALVRGPVTSSTSPREAIGGIVDYRTADFSNAPQASLAAGYDSAFGDFQHVRAVEKTGRLGIVTDAVTGGGDERSQVVKARYDFSSATSLELDSYGSQATTTVAGADVRTVAPVVAADLRTAIGPGTFEARTYRSAFSSATAGSAETAPQDENATSRGLQATYTVPAGENLYAIDLDRRTDALNVATSSLAQTVTTFGVRADLQLTNLSRLEVGERYSGIDGIVRRSDPFVGVSLRPNDRVTVRASAGSAFATQLDAAIPSAVAGALAPETSFGYRVSVDDARSATNHVFASAYDVRRFDRFATYADAHTTGVDAGISHDANGSGFGGSTYVALERSAALGDLQLPARIATVLTPQSLTALAGQPYAKIGTTLSFRTPGGVAYALQTTYFGANNALSDHAIALTDATVTLRLPNLGDLRAGLDNALGARITDPLLAPYYLPHEFVLVLNAHPGQRPQ